MPVKSVWVVFSLYHPHLLPFVISVTAILTDTRSCCTEFLICVSLTLSDSASDHTRAMCMLSWITYLSLMTSVVKRISMYVLVIYPSSKKFFCFSENIPRELWYRVCWLSWKRQAASWLLEHTVKLKLSTRKNPRDTIAFKSVDK